jgi:hypothetical protein
MGPNSKTKLPDPSSVYGEVKPPTPLLVLSLVALVVNLGLLLFQSYTASIFGLVLTLLTLGLVAAYRLVLSKRESESTYVPRLWQTKVAAAVLVVNFLAACGHAWFIGEEVGKRWS